MFVLQLLFLVAQHNDERVDLRPGDESETPPVHHLTSSSQAADAGGGGGGER